MDHDRQRRWAAETVSRLLKEIHFPHSLGLLYSAFTYYTGFKVNSGEYKLMGLAPYGEPIFAGKILEHLIDLKPDGSFRLDQDYFNYMTGFTMTNARFDELFGETARSARRALDQVSHERCGLCSGGHRRGRAETDAGAREPKPGKGILCLAGGVALNCVANGKVLRDGQFKKIWVQPAAGDAGGAVGAALAATTPGVRGCAENRTTRSTAMAGAYLGPSFDNEHRRAFGCRRRTASSRSAR